MLPWACYLPCLENLSVRIHQLKERFMETLITEADLDSATWTVRERGDKRGA